MRPELVFLSAFLYYEHKIDSFFGVNLMLNFYFYRKSLNLNENSTKSEQNHAKYHVFTQKF